MMLSALVGLTAIDVSLLGAAFSQPVSTLAVVYSDSVDLMSLSERKASVPEDLNLEIERG
jgi:hypothetical protein